eukprot:TRINITY_DN3799_c1_g1_i1.p1 TRINITY_DN3799_c1_g1~~TRINITY_DN3799_c1_g1_i1.p1  ORF type:complete len:115 (-),score=7.20 TRINITY_DN3799_c1_g1_i1:9-353(-)
MIIPWNVDSGYDMDSSLNVSLPFKHVPSICSISDTVSASDSPSPSFPSDSIFTDCRSCSSNTAYPTTLPSDFSCSSTFFNFSKDVILFKYLFFFFFFCFTSPSPSSASNKVQKL